ncbi:MAG: hypothetical protein KA764_10075 [Anaerolineales bacterium]|nr:hypothetical protein [Anaerolineales bacterium]
MALPIQITPDLILNLEHVASVEHLTAAGPAPERVRLSLLGQAAPREIPWTAGGERLWKLYAWLASRQFDHIRYAGCLVEIPDAFQAAGA